MARLTGKLTPKSLGWDRMNIALALSTTPPSERVLLGMIGGVVTGFKETVDDDKGEIYRGLKGSFKGVSVKADPDGVIIENRSGVCYLPGGIQDMIESAWNVATDVTNGGDAKATVSFVINLFAIHATNKAGYSFEADNLIAASKIDPLDALLERAKPQGAIPSLEAETPADTAVAEGDKEPATTPETPPVKGGKAK